MIYYSSNWLWMIEPNVLVEKELSNDNEACHNLTLESICETAGRKRKLSESSHSLLLVQKSVRIWLEYQPQPRGGVSISPGANSLNRARYRRFKICLAFHRLSRVQVDDAIATTSFCYSILKLNPTERGSR